MAQEIKVTRDGRSLTYDRGSVLLAGQFEALGTALVVLTAKERAGVPAGYTCRIGRIVLTGAEADALRQADAAYRAELDRVANMPVHRERRRITDLYAASERARHATDDDQLDRHFRLRAQADQALAAWREAYPDAAREERKQELRARADHERELAAGALIYDADGWISREEQQRRHDEHMRQAQQIEAEAATT